MVQKPVFEKAQPSGFYWIWIFWVYCFSGRPLLDAVR